jgi:hypothetical protein
MLCQLCLLISGHIATAKKEKGRATGGADVEKKGGRGSEGTAGEPLLLLFCCVLCCLLFCSPAGALELRTQRSCLDCYVMKALAETSNTTARCAGTWWVLLQLRSGRHGRSFAENKGLYAPAKKPPDFPTLFSFFFLILC